ncbi:MAG TPA: tetratricopeptide repeat protein [Pyrinomonadaceae bacterium]|nr:tetratricopeptide repeat protein [Pyrinomonadaceae bacterium]
MRGNRYFLGLTTLALLVSSIILLPASIDAQGKKNPKKDAENARKLVVKADQSMRKKDYRAAITMYTDAIALHPENADAHFWKGVAHHYLNENTLALPELEAAATNGYKDMLSLYRIRWRVYYDAKNYDAALADIQKGLALDPNSTEFLQGLGDISFAKNNFADAADAYKKVADKNPNTAADLYYLIARSKSNLGDTEGQIVAAEEAVKRGTQYLGEAHTLIADGYWKQKKYDEAIAAYQKVIATKPNTYSAYENLAELYRDQNKFNEGIEVLRKARSVFSQDGKIYTSLSWFYSLAGRNDEAIQAAQAGITLLPDAYLAYTNLCRAYNDAKKPDMAIRECNNALKRNPNDGETFFYLARAHDLAGKPDEATKYYKQAVTGLVETTKRNPEQAESFYLLGNAYYADNQREKAIDAYERCLALSPRFAKARYNIGIALLRQKNKTAALEQYNRLLELDPELAGRLKAEIDKS